MLDEHLIAQNVVYPFLSDESAYRRPTHCHPILILGGRYPRMGYPRRGISYEGGILGERYPRARYSRRGIS